MYLVCGEALFDFFSEEDVSGLASKVNFKAIAGGSPFNVAVGLRRLGVEAALFAGLSSDYLGKRLQQVLQDERQAQALGMTGVPLMLVRRAGAPLETAVPLQGAVPYEHLHATARDVAARVV